MRGVKLTAGLLVGAILIGTVPATALAATPADAKYITGTTYSFSAGAHSAITETVVDVSVMEEISGVSENDAPVVTEAPDPYENIAIAQVDEYLNIRAEANAEAEILGKLYTNGAATVLETLDGWYKITSGNVTGYVSADYVIVGDEAACKAASTRVGTINTETLKLRKEASTESGIHTLLAIDTKVKVLDESIEGWLQVQYESYTGYIAAEYANVETVYTYAESKEEEAARIAKEQEAARKAAQASKSSKKRGSGKTYNAPTTGNGQGVVNYAVQFVGNPYVWGGTSLTNGADCSGFVMKVYQAFGVSLPHSSYALRNVGYAVSESDVQPGDIICYSGHVAIYMGNGKIVHASNKKDGIKITNNWKYRKVVAIRRVI